MGGLSRRATLIEEGRENHPVAVVDGGDLFGKTAIVSSALLQQSQEKARLLMGAMSMVGLDAWVPGEADWALGREFVLNLVKTHDVPLLAGNLKCGEEWFPGHRVIERDGRRLGFIGVVEEGPAGCEVSDPVQAAAAAAAAMGQVDLLVGIFHGDAELDGRVLDVVPQIDFFFNGHTGRSQANPRQVKSSWFLGAGQRGKYIGRLGLEWTGQEGAWVSAGEQSTIETRMERYKTRVETTQKALKEAKDEKEIAKLQRRILHHQTQVDKLGKEIGNMQRSALSGRRFRHSLVDLGSSLENHAATEAMVLETKTRIEAMGSNELGLEASGWSSTLPFVGSAVCESCHPAQTAQWKTTAHAHAWETLVADKRSMDADCFSCHVTGAHHPEGPKLPTEVSGLTDVGCEACHGPGQAHIGRPVGTMKALDAAVRCVDCHDGVQDEGRFDAAVYLPKVQH